MYPILSYFQRTEAGEITYLLRFREMSENCPTQVRYSRRIAVRFFLQYPIIAGRTYIYRYIPIMYEYIPNYTENRTIRRKKDSYLNDWNASGTLLPKTLMLHQYLTQHQPPRAPWWPGQQQPTHQSFNVLVTWIQVNDAFHQATREVEGHG